MKNNKFLMIISVLLLFVMLIGATFSFFAVAINDSNSIAAEAATFGGAVEISALYTGKPLIPMDDTDVEIAFNDTNKCVDIYGYGACQAYNITVTNTGNRSSYIGTINFNLNRIENLKYTLIDDNGDEYVEKTLILTDTDQSLGDSFFLNKDESKTFHLIIWLSNIEDFQDNEDAGGSFSASVTYTSSMGTRITGTFSGH